MTLFKLSLKNIHQSLKDYAIYFFTLILGVAIFYIFNAMDSQTIMIEATSSKREMIELTVQVMSVLSVFVSFVLGFLIIYASQFLIKRRKKEFAIYMLLGMSKAKISRVLLLETLSIGLVSLIAGLGIGVVLSQGMSVVVASLFEVPMTGFRFVFSLSATLKTFTYFSIMYILVMIFNTITVNRCRLIELLQARSKSEPLKLKNPWLCILVFGVACILLAQAYHQVAYEPLAGFIVQDIFRLMAQGGIATFLVFWSLSGLILRAGMHLKGFYYHHLNSFILREIDAKINTMVFSMTIICLMLFMTVTVLASCLSLKDATTKELATYFPVDAQLSSDQPVARMLEDASFDLNQFSSYMSTTTYYGDHLQRRDLLGSYASEAYRQYTFVGLDYSVQIISVSDYNALSAYFHHEPIQLADHEYAISCNYETMAHFYNIALSRGNQLTIGKTSLVPAYTTCLDSFIHPSPQTINEGLLIVPDHCVAELNVMDYMLTANYQANTDSQREAIDQQLNTLAHDLKDQQIYLFVDSKIETYASSIGLGTMLTFIGIYLGIVFLISSAAILALKQLSDCSDNKQRYVILRKIGTDEKWISRAVLKQTAIIFGFPLLIAMIHSYFGIRFILRLFAYNGQIGLSSSIYMTALFLIMIYGGYFVITYLSSRMILKEDR